MGLSVVILILGLIYFSIISPGFRVILLLVVVGGASLLTLYALNQSKEEAARTEKYKASLPPPIKCDASSDELDKMVCAAQEREAQRR